MSRLESFFFFNDTATTEIYTLSLHDALPISRELGQALVPGLQLRVVVGEAVDGLLELHQAPDPELVPVVLGADRKSTRLNSSHANISYAVFCLKKKKKNPNHKNLVTQITLTI